MAKKKKIQKVFKKKENNQKSSLIPLLVVLIVFLFLANMFFLNALLQDKKKKEERREEEGLFEIRSKNPESANSLTLDNQNSDFVGKTSQNSASNTTTITTSENVNNLVSSNENTNIEELEYRTMEITNELRTQLLEIALQEKIVQQFNLNEISDIQITFLPVEKIKNEKELNQLFQELPEKDLFLLNYSSNKGNFFGVIDLNAEQILLFYKVLSPIKIG